MIAEKDVIGLIDGLARAELRAWVRAGWVRPARRGRRYVYREIDVARIRFILEIRHDLRVGDDAVPVVLSLVDQIHGLRGTLKALAAAVEAQPEPVRRNIAVMVAERRPDRARRASGRRRR
jgi:chaperone modulatory protein CbpM